MKFCSECGACLEPTFKFCIKCGTRTSENICSTAEKSCNEVSRKENETAEDLEAGPSLKMGALDSNLALLKAKFEQSRGKMAKKRKASFTPEVDRTDTSGCMETDRTDTSGCMETDRTDTSGCMETDRTDTSGCMETDRTDTSGCMETERGNRDQQKIPSLIVEEVSLDVPSPVEPLESPCLEKRDTERQLMLDDMWELPELDKGKCMLDENEKNLQDDEGVMNNLKEYEEMMQKKKERQAFADSTFIKFPSLEEPSIRVSVIYESHGGLSINRPFKVTETLSSIYTWILSEVEPEILPPVFHLECRKPSSCEQSNCPHIWELEKTHSKKITELPPVLFLREGNFSANDTLTGFGDVLFSELA
uniref:Uncharacterized protein LOC111100118 isoform X2 n=1 Tax=Crassostrea virginica TaxID=6565 RepID=A0A8B8A7J6_CRAVI|nr:uncharacterized protein LOC111100118 isoform X2 [Crassostrea virginica]